MTDNIPSIDQSEAEDFTSAFRMIFGKMMQNTDDMLPARVVSYDRGTNMAVVQPMIMMISTGGDNIQRAHIAEVPVMQYGGGGFLLSFPLQPGNLGWIKANDRDTSIFLQSFDMSIPNTHRVKSFSDAVFIPDVMTGYTISGDDEDSAVLQNLSGSVKISISSSKVKITAPDVEVVSDTLTHNGVNVGATHTHSGVAIGAGNTGVPQ